MSTAFESGDPGAGVFVGHCAVGMCLLACVGMWFMHMCVDMCADMWVDMRASMRVSCVLCT